MRVSDLFNARRGRFNLVQLLPTNMIRRENRFSTVNTDVSVLHACYLHCVLGFGMRQLASLMTTYFQFFNYTQEKMIVK